MITTTYICIGCNIQSYAKVIRMLSLWQKNRPTYGSYGDWRRIQAGRKGALWKKLGNVMDAVEFFTKTVSISLRTFQSLGRSGFVIFVPWFLKENGRRKRMTPNEFEPSKYQKAIYKFALEGEGNTAINAVAGSGKTHTLTHTAKIINSQGGVSIAFNKSIVEELNRRLYGTNVRAQTCHSLGNRALTQRFGYCKIHADKYSALAEEIFPDHAKDGKLRIFNALPAMVEVVNHARMALCDLTDHDAVSEMIEHNMIELPEEKIDGCEDSYPRDQFYTECQILLDYGISRAERLNIIDFTDMIFLPVHLRLRANCQFDWMFVDECQDLSPAQVSFLRRIDAGRVICVGDPHQAIYGFAGADCDSFNNVVDAFKAQQLPLSICYRCPKKVVELAKKFVPQIEASATAAEGFVGEISTDDMRNVATSKDLVLCRKNAPLVSFLFKLYKAGVPAKFIGRDVGKQFITLIDRIVGAKRFNFGDFGNFVDNYFAKKIEKAEGEKKQSLVDQREVIVSLHKNLKATTLAEFCGKVEEIFDPERPGVRLSTIHRAKGLENDTVFLLREGLKMRWPGQRDWQKQQEKNLEYVAITRAKKELYFVG